MSEEEQPANLDGKYGSEEVQKIRCISLTAPAPSGTAATAFPRSRFCGSLNDKNLMNDLRSHKKRAMVI